VFLKRLSNGDEAAETPLAEAVYGHMQRIARRIAGSGGSGFSMQPTMLVNEVLLELIRIRNLDWQDRNHFFRTASRLLRRRFIDYIRMRKAQKRPSDENRAHLDVLLMPTEERFDEIILVNEGLAQLAAFDPPLAELVEMSYFGGVSIADIAELRKVSEKTIDRHLDLARRWLAKKLGEPCPSLHSKCASSGET